MNKLPAHQVLLVAFCHHKIEHREGFLPSHPIKAFSLVLSESFLILSSAFLPFHLIKVLSSVLSERFGPLCIVPCHLQYICTFSSDQGPSFILSEYFISGLLSLCLNSTFHNIYSHPFNQGPFLGTF